MLTASAADEISQDFDAKKHGLFTYYLLKGLRGEANANGDEWITVKELHDYVVPRAQDESKRLGYNQTPQFLPAPTGDRAEAKIAKVAR